MEFTLLGALLAALSLPVHAQGPARPDLSRVESLVVEGTNAFRRSERLGPVERNERLDAAAKAFAAYMASIGEFSHEADGSSPSARARLHGYDFCLVSENIAYHYSTSGYQTADLAKRLVEGWKSSPGHRRNMVEPNVIHTGIGVAHVTRKGLQHYYAVQMFGRPRSASIEFTVTNATTVPVSYRVGDRAFTAQPRAIRTHVECTPQTVRFEVPGATNPNVTEFTTRKGDKFAVVQERGQVSIKRD